MRGGGACGGRGGGTTVGGLGTEETDGGAGDGIVAVVDAVWEGGCGACGVTGRGGATAGGAETAGEDWATSGAGEIVVGLAIGVGTTMRGTGGGATGGCGALIVGLLAAGLLSAAGGTIAGRAGGGVTMAGACCFRIAFSTSPGREI